MSNRKVLLFSGAFVATVSAITAAVLIRRRLNSHLKQSCTIENEIDDDDAEVFAVSASPVYGLNKSSKPKSGLSDTSAVKSKVYHNAAELSRNTEKLHGDEEEESRLTANTSGVVKNKQMNAAASSSGSSSGKGKSDIYESKQHCSKVNTLSDSNANTNEIESATLTALAAQEQKGLKSSLQLQKQQEQQELYEQEEEEESLFVSPAKDISTHNEGKSSGNEGDEDDDNSLFDAAFEEVAQHDASPELTSTTLSSKNKMSENDPFKSSLPEDELTYPTADEEARVAQVDPNALSSGVTTLNVIKPTTTTTTTTTSTTVATGNKVEFPFEELGVTLRVPVGWEATREVSPMPNLCMITVSNPSIGVIDSPEAASTVPLIVLTMEDMHAENLNVAEFSERSKQVSIQQMEMMTNGLVRPVIQRDQGVSEGPFRRVLEYAQYIPPMFNITVLNLIEVRNGIAYVFQVTCRSNLMSEYKPLFLEMARSITINPIAAQPNNYLRLHTGTIEVQFDSVWSWELPEEANANEPLVIFHLMSTVKKERMELYKSGEEPAATCQLRESKNVKGVTIESYFDGTQEYKKFIFGSYTLVVQPLQKAVSYIPEETLIWVIQSVTPSSIMPESNNVAEFVNTEKNYSFEVTNNGQIIASALNKGTVLYFPHGKQMMENSNNAGGDKMMMGANMNMEDRGPVVTVRCATPEDEEDCMETLAEWKNRVSTDTSLGHVTNVRESTIRGMPCVSFNATDMQETAPDQRIEMRESAYIFCKDRVSTVIRWECVASQWRKYERELKAFIDTFTVPGMDEKK